MVCGVFFTNTATKPFAAGVGTGVVGARTTLGTFATAEAAALAVARFLGPEGAAAAPGRKRPAASGAPAWSEPLEAGKQLVVEDDDEHVVGAEAVSDDDGVDDAADARAGSLHCERLRLRCSTAVVCAQLVEGDFLCILGREDE